MSYPPTDPKFGNTTQCFILSEWMKHGTCAVIPGADGNAFRLSQESYFRTAFVLASEFNANAELRQQLDDPGSDDLESNVSAGCVQCAYLATVGWEGTDVQSVPRMSGDCVDQCFACGDSWDLCPPAQLNSPVELDPSNAPVEASDSGTNSDGVANFAVLDLAMPAFSSSNNISPWEGTWRSFGAEQGGSGKFEFAQTFTDKALTVTTDSPYPQTCSYERRGSKELILRCGGNRLEECLVQRLPDIGELEAAFLACNHTSQPAPASFYAAMDTPGCGNFLMFRCKASADCCSFSPDAFSPPSKSETKTKSDSEPSPVSHSQRGIAGAPTSLLGLWRSLQVSSHHEDGLANWSFTSDGQASLKWPNHPERGVEFYSVSHSRQDPNRVLLTTASGAVTTCHFTFQYQPVYSYAMLNCVSGDKKTQWAMGRCNPCSAECRYSCSPENDNCGAGSCDPADSSAAGAFPPLNDHRWCAPEDSSCWPTKTAIKKLEKALDPTVPRLGLQWDNYPTPQPAPVLTGSINNQAFYGLSSAGLKAMYYYENIEEMKRPCFNNKDGVNIWNTASDMCKAALHQNEYRNWNPFIVVFPLNQRHITAALKFAAQHRLCITAGTGHEYNSRNSCPTGGILIRTILLKNKEFLPAWSEDPALAPAGAFRFGAGSIFAEMHAFSAKKIVSRQKNPQLFWAMRGGGGGVWGVILSMTLRAHAVPDGGLSRVFMSQSGTFCPGPNDKLGYEWLREMWPRFAEWQLRLNSKVSTQPGFFIDTSKYKKCDLCTATWTSNFEYFYAGGQKEQEYAMFRDSLKDVLQTKTVQEDNFNSAYDCLLSMPPNKFQISVMNPLPAPHEPSDDATGSQNSVFVSRQDMETNLKTPDKTSPDPMGWRCGFHYLYTSITGNLGSAQPDNTAISPGFRSGLMLWNARTLSTKQCEDTIYKLGGNSYFSESSSISTALVMISHFSPARNMNSINQQILFWLNEIPPHLPHPPQPISKKRSLSDVVNLPPSPPLSGNMEEQPATPAPKKRKLGLAQMLLARAEDEASGDESRDDTPRQQPSRSATDTSSQRGSSHQGTSISKQSSPTKHLSALSVQPYQLVQKTLSLSDSNVPESLKQLYQDMKDISDGNGAIPKYLEREIPGLSPAHGSFTPGMYDKDEKRYPPASHRQVSLGDVMLLESQAIRCSDSSFDEHAWNGLVHLPLLNTVFHGSNSRPSQLDGFAPWQVSHLLLYQFSLIPMNSTSASILPQYKIKSASGKKVNYVCYIKPENDPAQPNLASTIDTIRTSLEDASINHTDYIPDCLISFSIETKRGDESGKKAALQMGHPPFIPDVIVQGHEWKFMASVFVERKTILWTTSRGFGSTEEFSSTFRVIAGVQRLRVWALEVSWPWYKHMSVIILILLSKNEAFYLISALRALSGLGNKTWI
ncbi:isoamyl alcohol oxidase [Fusarium agapanthi]|uniref:Isoamyl alcohol oxidase n=1 Tax=Fusarium agapanthi TaxID=1803897 RepID=A0A9P5EB34_9HYPO|nr:isoamyl alcohol oxidase [Fusarium agapanthi]